MLDIALRIVHELKHLAGCDPYELGNIIFSHLYLRKLRLKEVK